MPNIPPAGQNAAVTAYIDKVAALTKWACAENGITHPGDIATHMTMIVEVLAHSEQYDRQQHDPQQRDPQQHEALSY